MKTYKNTADNTIWAFDDDVLNPLALASSPLTLIPHVIVPPTAAELAAINAPRPSANGFIQDIKAALGGIVGANSLAASYPLFFTAVQSAAWADVQTLIIDAHTKTLLTDAQYATFKAAATANNIPVTL